MSFFSVLENAYLEVEALHDAIQASWTIQNGSAVTDVIGRASFLLDASIFPSEEVESEFRTALLKADELFDGNALPWRALGELRDATESALADLEASILDESKEWLQDIEGCRAALALLPHETAGSVERTAKRMAMILDSHGVLLERVKVRSAARPNVPVAGTSSSPGM